LLLKVTFDSVGLLVWALNIPPPIKAELPLKMTFFSVGLLLPTLMNIPPPELAPTNVTIRLPGGDGEAVQHGGAIRRPVAGDDVIGVRPGDIGRVCDHAIGVGEVVLVNIAAQDGDVGRPVALSRAVSVPAKPP
jgi:hypothetical protein